MKKRNVNLILLQLLLLCVAGIIVLNMFGAAKGTSLLFMLTFPLTCGLWLWSLRKGLRRSDYIMLATAVLAAVCVGVDLAVHKGSFSFSYIRKLIMFIMTLMYLQAQDKFRPDWRLEEFIQVLVDVLTVLMGLMLLLFKDAMYTINGVVSRYLTFGFGNPNAVAMYLAPMFMMTFCTLLRQEKPGQKLFHGAVLLLLGLFVLLTQSRNALMMTLLFAAVAVFVLLRERIEKVTDRQLPMRYNRWVSWGVALFPMIFAIFYMIFIGSDWVSKLFGFMVSEGKDLDSRVKMWTPAFEAILRSPLIGSYYSVSGGTGSSQMHSTHVDTAACYGIPVMLLMSYMQKRYIHQKGKTYHNKVHFMYMTAFCCALLMGTFEAAVYSGGLGVYVFALIFLSLSKCRGPQPGTVPVSGWEWVGTQGKLLYDRWQSGRGRSSKRVRKHHETEQISEE